MLKSKDEQSKICNNDSLKCPHCFSDLFIKFSSSKINLHCDCCGFWKKLEINENIFNEIFNPLPISKKQVPKEIQCEKCLKYYCSFCYIKHNDIVNELSIDETKFIHNKKNNNKTSFQEKLTYSNYNIRCEKCNRQYLSDIIGSNIYPKKNIYYVKKDLSRGKEYLNNYFTNLKNEIINELQENIKQIELAFTKNYNYHIHIFRIIDKLLEIYNSNNSNTIYKSLLTFSNFSFPTININDINSTDQKIIEIKHFYENEFIIKDTLFEKEKFFKNFQILELYKPSKVFKLGSNKIVYNDYFSIKIYNLFDFSLILNIPFPRVSCVLSINDKTLLFVAKNSLHICYLTKNGYKLDKIFKSRDENYSIHVLKDNQIRIIEDRVVKILSTAPPYNILKTVEFEDHICEINDLFDGSTLVTIFDEVEDEYRLEYYNKEGKKEVNKTIHIKREESFSYLTQIDNKKIFWFWISDNKMIIYNLFSNQIETKIFFKDKICRFADNFPNEQKFSIIFKDSFCIYDKQTFQLIFTFQHKLMYLTKFILLKNGTFLGLYDWNLRYILKKKNRDLSNYFYDDDEMSQDLSFFGGHTHLFNLKRMEENINRRRNYQGNNDMSDESIMSNCDEINEDEHNDYTFNNYHKINIEDLNDEGINHDNGKCY